MPSAICWRPVCVSPPSSSLASPACCFGSCSRCLPRVTTSCTITSACSATHAGKWLGTCYQSNPENILDLSTGTGDAALQMATLFPQARIVGVDFSTPVLRIARSKAEQLGVSDRVSFVDGDAAMLPFADGPSIS